MTFLPGHEAGLTALCTKKSADRSRRAFRVARQQISRSPHLDCLLTTREGLARTAQDSRAKRRALTSHDRDCKQGTSFASECREAVQTLQHPFRRPLKVRVRWRDT